MSYASRETVVVTTDASGDGTSYSAVITGKIKTIVYVKTDFADTVDFAITLEGTGEGLWSEDNITASTVRAPRQPCHSQVGAALHYNDADDCPVVDHIVATNDRVKIVVANGGDTKAGTFYVIVG